MIGRYALMIALLLTGMARSANAVPTAQDVKEKVAALQDGLQTLSGEFTARYSRATSQGMQLREELTGNFITSGHKKYVCYQSNGQRVVYTYDGRISNRLRSSRDEATPVGHRWIGTKTSGYQPRQLTPLEFTGSLFGQSLTDYAFVDRGTEAEIIGYTQPVVGFSQIYKIQIHEQEGDLVTALAISPEPSTYGYAILTFDASKDMALVRKNIYTKNDVLRETLVASDYIRVENAWVPQQIVATQYRAAENGPRAYKRTELTYRNCAVPAQVPAGLFRVRFPENVRLKDEAGGASDALVE